MFDLNIEKTHKRGRPRKRGKRIDYHNLEYKKDGKFFVAHIKVAVNLIDTPVYITITNLSTTIFISISFKVHKKWNIIYQSVFIRNLFLANCLKHYN